MTRRRRAAVALAALGAAGIAAAAQVELERLQAERDASWHLLYLPSGRYLKVASLGFAPLIADLVYLWSIQYYGSYHPSVRYDLVEKVYVGIIGELDPRYRDAYTLASLILVAEARDPERALRVLDAGIERNPDDWLLPFEAGFIAFNSLGDHERAAGYYARAMDLPGAPPFTRRLHAEMYNRMGDKHTSYARWLEVYETTEDESVRQIAWSHVHDLKIEIDLALLRGRVREYRERRGGWPGALGTLVREALLDVVPLDPEGLPYLYDPGTGEVRSQSKFRLWRR